MASAIEHYESRTGDVSADRQGFGASRTFIVKVDSVYDNPDDVLRNPDLLETGSSTTRVGVPFGSPHPTRTGLFSAFYAVERRLQTKTFRVRIVYAPPLLPTTQENPWELRYAPGLASRQVFRDWNDNPIGPASYGPPVLPNPPGTEQYSVTIPKGRNNEPETRYFIRFDGLDAGVNPSRPAFLEPADRTESLATFELSRVFPRLDDEIMAGIVASANVVNSKTFYSFAARTVKFIGPSALAGQGVIPDTGTEGFIYRVGLVFEVNPRGYRLQRQDVFRHTDGRTYPVFHEDGSPVFREWQMYLEADLYLLVALLDRYATYTTAPGRDKRTPRPPRT